MAKKKKSGNKAVVVIILIVAVLALIAFAVFGRSMSRVSKNPPGTLGNFGGNINNEGLFCQDGDTVYFINTLDNNFIYSMNVDCTDYKLVQDVSARYLNSAGNFLYYNQTGAGDTSSYGFIGNMNGIYRLKKGGRGNTKGLDRAKAKQLILIGDNVFYQHYDDSNGITLYRCSVNGGDREEVYKGIVNLSCVIDETILFPDQDRNFEVYTLDTKTGNTSPFINTRMYNPVYNDGYIYYISIDDKYRLYRFDLNKRTEEKLTDDRVDCFNVIGNVLFYQKNDKQSPALIRMNVDGRSMSVVAEGNYENINITTLYTYFHEFGHPQQMYRVSTTGNSTPQAFNPEVIERKKNKFVLGGEK